MESRGTILLTCAGRSERFAAIWGAPKWALTHPSGNIMAAEAILSMGTEATDWDVVVAVNRDDAQHYGLESITREMARAGIRATVVDVGRPRTRVTTVLRALEDAEVCPERSVCIRDCDNALRFALEPETAVAVSDVTAHGHLDPGARSYVDVTEDGKVTFAQERGHVSRWFCAGAYVFSRCELFEELADGVSHVTDVVRRLVMAGGRVAAREVSIYEDWGTGRDWLTYRQQHRTLFVDVDGLLFESAHRTFSRRPQGSNRALVKNCRALRGVFDRGRVCIVITTARSEELRGETIKQLHDAGIRWHHLLMGLPACGRAVINDVDATRGERSADAVQVDRDSDGDLAGALRQIGL